MNKYFIDGGAHCGESILRARREFGDDINIISFEPIPYFAKELHKIYEKDPKVVIYNKAIWVDDCIKKFNICKNFTDAPSLFNISAGNSETLLFASCIAILILFMILFSIVLNYVDLYFYFLIL